ncbi:processed acidic surface protein [Bacillus sp. EAC]|uniref:processed acidic surface protein n=1 Tax=Bacillus sp. EAC TaxID=1978338 RepID=UPI000B4514D3|nr:processed acidic surface protein [Bacillus sp. EAC]
MKKVVASIVLSAALIAPGLTAQAAPNKTELTTYLKSIDMTQIELENYLKSNYGESIADYDSVDELKDTLGEPLTKESLAAILTDYDYTEDQVKELAVYYDDMDENASLLETYYFTSDIENLILLESDSSGEMPSMDDMSKLLDSFGITQTEIDHVSSYIEKVMKDDPSAEAKLQVLAERMTNLSDKYADIFSMDTAPDELPAELSAELTNIVKELQSTLKIDVKVAIEQNGVKTPLTFAKMLMMDDSADSMANAKVYLDIYDNSGNLLLDAVVTEDLLLNDDLLGMVNDVKVNVKNHSNGISRTENGGKLPKTATHTTEWAFVGIFMMLSALVLRRKVIAKR